MSCNLIAIGLEIQKVTRINISARTKQNTILFKTRIVVALFIYFIFILFRHKRTTLYKFNKHMSHLLI